MKKCRHFDRYFRNKGRSVSKSYYAIMPTSSGRNVAVHRQPKRVSNGNKIRTKAVREKNNSTSVQPELPKSRKRSRVLRIASFVLLGLLIVGIIALAITIPLVFRSLSLATTTMITTTKATTATTKPNCVSPYTQLPSGSCVNTLLDFNNCGAIGNVCPSTYTSCSAAVCSNVPVVQLKNATSIWTGGVNGPADDNIMNVNLPFPITVYNTTTSSVQVTPNGVLCLGYCSTNWLATTLPSPAFGATVFPYWDDLSINGKTWQGIYLASQGTTPSRTLVLEYYTSQYGSPDKFYHFQVIFFEAAPGIVQLNYLEADDTGASCTIGVQASGSGPYIQYSFDQVSSVQPNMNLTFNTTIV